MIIADVLGSVHQWAVTHKVTDKNSFFYFQLKDLVTFALAVVGFLVASSSFLVAFAILRINYLRPPKLKMQLGRMLYLDVPGVSGTKGITISCDVILFNIGAQAALADYARIRVKRCPWWRWAMSRRRTVGVLPWVWFLKTENIAKKGEAGRIWTSREARADAVAIPKYEVIVKEVAFIGPFDIPAGNYKIRLECQQLNSRRKLYNMRRPFYRSTWRKLILDPFDIQFIKTCTCLNDQGTRPGYCHVRYEDRVYQAVEREDNRSSALAQPETEKINWSA